MGYVHRLLNEDVVLKATRFDVAPIAGIRRPDALEAILDSILRQSGKELSYKDLPGKESEPTQRNWLRALLDSGLIWELPQVDRSEGRRLRGRPKIYSVDSALVAAKHPGAPPPRRPVAFDGRDCGCYCPEAQCSGDGRRNWLGGQVGQVGGRLRPRRRRLLHRARDNRRSPREEARATEVRHGRRSRGPRTRSPRQVRQAHRGSRDGCGDPRSSRPLAGTRGTDWGEVGVVTAPARHGSPESQKLEYKAATALRDASGIARACVAMLNGGGGVVVVGVDDSKVVQGVDRAEAERDRLQQLLIDRIRPRPLQAAEVRVTPVGAARVLEIGLRPLPGVLYADRSGGRWGFWSRSGATSRALDWDEIVQKWPGDAPPHDFATEAPRWDEDIPDRWPGSSAVLVLRSFREEPATGGAGVRRPKYQELNSLLAGAAEQLGRGRIGWQVLRGHMRTEDLLKGTWDQRPARWLSLGKRLDLRFEGGEHYLAHRQPPNAPWRALYPYAVTEGPSSFARLLALLGEEFSLVGAVELTMALWTTGDGGSLPARPTRTDGSSPCPDATGPQPRPTPCRSRLGQPGASCGRSLIG